MSLDETLTEMPAEETERFVDELYKGIFGRVNTIDVYFDWVGLKLVREVPAFLKTILTGRNVYSPLKRKLEEFGKEVCADNTARISSYVASQIEQAVTNYPAEEDRLRRLETHVEAHLQDYIESERLGKGEIEAELNKGFLKEAAFFFLGGAGGGLSGGMFFPGPAANGAIGMTIVGALIGGVAGNIYLAKKRLLWIKIEGGVRSLWPFFSEESEHGFNERYDTLLRQNEKALGGVNTRRYEFKQNALEVLSPTG